MMRRRSFPAVRLALLVAATLAVAGCETMEKLNPFDERKAPLPGDRKPLFPEGVPGVNYGEPPPQPANAPPPAVEQPPEAATQDAPAAGKTKKRAKAKQQQEQQQEAPPALED
ncbi:hypothetical protein [Blastochloris tepida]|uniref:Lipoprotein n=1 Tax=Blastochloris tepida TaxID=2233851 RepID=A0A348G3P1_9HYPH|nr:hypothetical protein [Blastochloris tepida]BBF94174.1 hypothetical protein BLTE_28590 [Blastochloris tepida]